MEEGTWDVNHPGSELPLPNGNPARPVRARRVPPGIRSVRPAASHLGSCRIGAGLSSQTAASRPPSSSRQSGVSRARRRTSEEPPQTPRFGYRPRRTVGPPRRRIRRVGSYCGNSDTLGSTNCPLLHNADWHYAGLHILLCDAKSCSVYMRSTMLPS